jgi:hypothetical protein
LRPEPALLGAALLLSSCGGGAVARAPSSPQRAEKVDMPTDKADRATDLVALLGAPPDLLVRLHPPALQRDPVYGPLLRRAGEMASAYAGPMNLGTTALAVIERTDEVVVAQRARDVRELGKDAVILLRGVPADIDPLQVVDTAGHPIWKAVAGDTRTTSRELAPVQPAEAALFVTPGLSWIIASGDSVARVRAEVVAGGAGRVKGVEGVGTELPGDGSDTALASISMPGDVIPQLRQGALAPVGAGLTNIKLDLGPGALGILIARLAYVDAASAASAEGTVLAVTLAFRHRLEEDIKADGHAPQATAQARAARPGASLEWLGAAKVDREGATVIVRAPIPKPWLEALAKAEVTVPPP